MSQPNWLPRRQMWPVWFVVALAVVGVVIALVVVLTGDDEEARRRAVDDRVRQVCEQTPPPVDVAALAGGSAGRHQNGKGCVWGEPGVDPTLVVRRVPLVTLDEWTTSMGRAVTTSPTGARLVRSSAHCTAAFDDTTGAVIEVESPTSIDPDCAATSRAVDAIVRTVA